MLENVDPSKPAVPTTSPPMQSMPPTTTLQEDKVVERQSRINLTWEFTQATVAILLILTISIALLIGKEIKSEFWILVSIVVQAYFQRTNHTRVGGIGYKPPGETR